MRVERGGNADTQTGAKLVLTPDRLAIPLALSTSRGLFLSGLQFPYPTDVTDVSGRVTLILPNALPRELSNGSSARVPANKRFDILLLPATDILTTGRCVLTLDRAGTQHDDDRRLVSREASKLVFESPADAWNVELLAKRLGISITRLRARLFVESAGARYIIKTQRMQHAFVMLLTTDLPLSLIAASAGWPNGRALRLALRDGLMIDPEHIKRARPKPALRTLPKERLWCGSLLLSDDARNERPPNLNEIHSIAK